jgi:hypothetical protein
VLSLKPSSHRVERRPPSTEVALVEGYSPGGPGAVLIFEGERDDVDRAIEALPLIRDGIVEAEVTELRPFQALGG